MIQSKRLTAMLLAATLLISTLALPSAAESTTTQNSSSNARPSQTMRGVWVASVLNIDYPSKATTDSEKLKSEAIAALDKAQEAGLNAVFLQVRPTGDALYQSKYFPWSKYLTGKQGLAPSNNFDPLYFWIDEAHKRGIQLHAWVNPYRITKKFAKDPAHDFASLTPDHPANLHPDWVVKHTDGNLYFNPGIPAVRQYIIDSSLEIVQNYNVDGIHFDDYFYPGQTFNDADTFKTYGSGFKTVGDWRRDNVTQLIQGMSQTLKQSGKSVSFGISPFGIWANKSKNALGSDTNGNQSYSDHYADTRKWVKEGTIDYIAPQIYWNIGFKVADYAKLLAWWQNVVKGTQVKLYIGQATYRTGNSDVKSPWYGVDEISRQLALNAATPEVSGSIFYNYSSLKKSPALVSLLANTYGAPATVNPGNTVNVTPVVPVVPVVSVLPVTTPVTEVVIPVVQPSTQPVLPLNIARPANNLKTTYNSYFISGTSDPNQPLYVNGTVVADRSSRGYFGYYATLKAGKNVFDFRQGSNHKILVLTKSIPTASTSTKTMASPEISLSSTFPQMQEMRQAGEKVTLSCRAPIGATVDVQINGSTFTMTPTTAQTSQPGLVPTTYTLAYTMPNMTADSAPISLGNPIYTMSYNGVTSTKTAPADISVLSPTTPFYAEVQNEVIETYTGATNANGSCGELYKGMMDRITTMTGGFLRLNSGIWIRKENAQLYGSVRAFAPTVTTAQYNAALKWDTFELGMTQVPAAAAKFDGSTLTLTLSGTSSAAPVVLPSDSLFSSISQQSLPDKLVYTFKLKSGQTFSGFMINQSSNGLTLAIKKKPQPVNPARPLEGLTILLDAGHGGSDPGALGPMGEKLAEKHINLNIALKLQKALVERGARVEMTRSTDVKVTLADRLAISRSLKPDLFISIHANSLENSANLNKVKGFSVYYNEPFSKQVSQLMLKRVVTDLARNNRGANVMHFYVTKGSWSPALLLETGFVPNPYEFEWLTEEASSTALSQKLADGVESYFSKP